MIIINQQLKKTQKHIKHMPGQFFSWIVEKNTKPQLRSNSSEKHKNTQNTCRGHFSHGLKKTQKTHKTHGSCNLV